MSEQLFVKGLPLPITVTAGHRGLRSVRFGELGSDSAGPLTERAARQLREYFAGTRFEFDLPLDPEGTAFQLKVWSALCDVKYGATASYRDVAIAVERPKGFQAIGQANTRNPLPILIPCHRIVNADGSLGGYGAGIAIKQTLLDLERRHSAK